MQLTQTQRQRIAEHLRSAAADMEAAPADVRAQALIQIKQRIANELRRLNDDPPTDADVAAVLARYGAVAQDRSEDGGASRAQERSSRETGDDRRWLGVCAALASQTGVTVSLVRGAFVVLGLFTGPLALTLYVVLYFVKYNAFRENGAPGVLWTRFAKWVLGDIAGAALLFALAKATLFGMHYAYATFLAAQEEPALGAWAWLDMYDNALFIAALAVTTPPAMLAGLPLANAWDRTLGKLAQAGLAVYAVVLSVGLASALAGMILRGVEEMAGSHFSAI